MDFGLKTAQDWTCSVHTGLLWCLPNWTSPANTRLVRYSAVLFPKNSYLLHSLFHLVHPLWLIFTLFLLSQDGPHHEKRSKKGQDVGWSSKCGHSSKALAGCYPLPPRHHPSHSSDEEEDDCEMFKRHAPIDRSSHMAIKYPKKMKQNTINENRESLVYEDSKQS
jgi:hypothetical protein